MYFWGLSIASTHFPSLVLLFCQLSRHLGGWMNTNAFPCTVITVSCHRCEATLALLLQRAASRLRTAARGLLLSLPVAPSTPAPQPPRALPHPLSPCASPALRVALRGPAPSPDRGNAPGTASRRAPPPIPLSLPCAPLSAHGGPRAACGGPASAMVLESVVADLLNRFLGDYVENLNKSQLKLGIWGGKEPIPPRLCGAAGPPLPPGEGASSRGERVSLAPVPVRSGRATGWRPLWGAGRRAACGAYLLLAPPRRTVAVRAAALLEGRSVASGPRTTPRGRAVGAGPRFSPVRGGGGRLGRGFPRCWRPPAAGGAPEGAGAAAPWGAVRRGQALVGAVCAPGAEAFLLGFTALLLWRWMIHTCIINNIALGSRVEALWWYKCSFSHVWLGVPVLPNAIFGRLWLFSLFHIALHRCWNHWTFFFHIGNVALDNLQIKENALVSIPVISSCISGSKDWALGLLTVCSLTSQSVPSLLVSESGAWLTASNTANVIGTKGKKSTG